MNETIKAGYVPVSVKIRRAAWNVACALLFRPFPTKLFRRWRLLLLRLFGANIHPSADVYSSCRLWAPWNLRMGPGSCLGPDTICYNQAMVCLEEDACVSQYAYICTAGHTTDAVNSADSGLIIAPVTLHRGAWVGTRAFIGMGAEIGENAIVGATASVYKDVPANAIVGGNPSKIIRYRNA